jgi:hypothetical protein
LKIAQIQDSLNAAPRQTRHPVFGLILRGFNPLRNTGCPGLLDQRLVDHLELVFSVWNILLAIAAASSNLAQTTEEIATARLGFSEHVFAAGNEGVGLLLGFLHGHVAARHWGILVTLVGESAVGGLAALVTAFGLEEPHVVLWPIC